MRSHCSLVRQKRSCITFKQTHTDAKIVQTPAQRMCLGYTTHRIFGHWYSSTTIVLIRVFKRTRMAAIDIVQIGERKLVHNLSESAPILSRVQRTHWMGGVHGAWSVSSQLSIARALTLQTDHQEMHEHDPSSTLPLVLCKWFCHAVRRSRQRSCGKV